VLILVVSPQRTALSVVAGGLYLAVALALARPTRAERPLLLYAIAVAGFIALAMARADLVDHPSQAQLEYAASKAFYFSVVVIPLSVAVGLLVRRPEALKPAAWVQMAVGSAVALLTVLLSGAHFLGAQRYTDQGNLIVLGLLVTLQLWVLRARWLVAVLGVVAVAGVMFANSRQSIAAILVGLGFTALYWWLSGSLTGAGPVRALLSPRVLLAGGLAMLLGAWIWFTLHPLFGAAMVAQGNGTLNPCHCVTDRLLVIANDPGDRGLLFDKGLQLFLSHPIFGGGLGSFVGLVANQPYPHSVVLEVAGELGLVGLLVIFGPLLYGWFRLAARGIRQGSAAIAVLLALVGCFLVISNLSGDIPSERGLWILGILALQLGLRPAEPTVADDR